MTLNYILIKTKKQFLKKNIQNPLYRFFLRSTLICLCLSFFANTVFVSGIFAQTIDSPCVVGDWSGFKKGAFTYTFDDFPQANGHYDIVVPLFDKYGFKATFYMITNAMDATAWDHARTMEQKGHEMGSHTVSHRRLPDLSLADQDYEQKTSRDVINQNIPCVQCMTIAYPYGDPGDESITAKYYIAGRAAAEEKIMPPNPVDFYNTLTFWSVLGSVANVNAIAVNAINNGGWGVLLIHNVPNDFSTANLKSTCDYMKSREADLWVANYCTVIRYIKERQTVSFKQISTSTDTITYSITDTLDNTLFNVPLSIRRPVPTGWSAVTVRQNNLVVLSSIVIVNDTKNVQFDVVPNDGDVVLTNEIPPPVAPTVTTTAISNITKTTAGSGGNVISEGGSSVTARGVYWATSSNTTTANCKTTDGTGTGEYLPVQ